MPNAIVITKKAYSGGPASYTVPFDYLSKDHVKVYVDDAITYNYQWTSDNIITFLSAYIPSYTSEVVIERVTPDIQLVDFTGGAPDSGENLDIATLQAIYLVQEARFGANNTLSVDADNKFNAEIRVITNVQSDPLDASAVATTGHVITVVDQAIANVNNVNSNIEARSEAYADSALISSVNAANSADTASLEAESAYSYSNTANGHRLNAQTFRDQAEVYKDEAESAKLDAESAATNAHNILIDLIGPYSSLITTNDPVRMVRGESDASLNGMYFLEDGHYIDDVLDAVDTPQYWRGTQIEYDALPSAQKDNPMWIHLIQT